MKINKIDLSRDPQLQAYAGFSVADFTGYDLEYVIRKFVQYVGEFPQFANEDFHMVWPRHVMQKEAQCTI